MKKVACFLQKKDLFVIGYDHPTPYKQAFSFSSPEELFVNAAQYKAISRGRVIHEGYKQHQLIEGAAYTMELAEKDFKQFAF